MVKKFIKEKMYEVFNDFKVDIKEMGKLCELKDCRFDGRNTPDYINPIMQRLYLLRYLPAYTIEYYLMYKQMFGTGFLGNDINVISIGSGCGIDFWGLKYACDKVTKAYNISYTGLDVVDWNYRDNLDIDEFYFLEDDLNNLTELDEESYNIIVFPKSIGELDDTTFANVKNIIRDTCFESDKIMLLSSIRKSRNNVDINRMSKLVSILETDHKYTCLDDKKIYWFYPDGEKIKLETICSEFIYPKEIRDYLLSLNTRCEGFWENWGEPCEENCKDMNRYPVSTASQIQYQVLRLER